MCGGMSLAWISCMCVIFSLPTVYPIGLETFNFASIGLLLILAWVALTWLLWARHWFQGPAPHICNSDAVKVRSDSWM